MRKKPGFPPQSHVSWEAWPSTRLPGWRRSADRACLQDSFPANSEFYRENVDFGRSETRRAAKKALHGSAFRVNSLLQLTGKYFRLTGASSLNNREFRTSFGGGRFGHGLQKLAAVRLKDHDDRLAPPFGPLCHPEALIRAT